MNASFEDVVVFDQFLEEHNGSWEQTFKDFERQRKKDTDAIADLAIDNFFEMRDHVANDFFKEKRKLEIALEKNFPEEYSSKYSLVTFNEDIGYNEAMIRGRAQDKAILNMIADGELDMTKDDLKEVLKKVNKITTEILDDDKVAQTMRH
jgi:kynurenine 3-monooxygenase